jgi:glucokinase-like ROK family protein
MDASPGVWLSTARQSPDEPTQSLVRVLDLIRSGGAVTRPEISRISGYGRTVVSQRLNQLMAAGLVREGELASSNGGRAPRQLSFVSDAGRLLVAQLGATTISAGIASLDGTVVTSRRQSINIADGPDRILDQVESIFDSMITQTGTASNAIWGVGIGLPGPVEYATGKPVAPPIMPGWDAYPVRTRLSHRYDAAVWVDNDVNLMALGELRCGVARGQDDIIYLKVGSGIGAGLVGEGRLHRGAQGSAGDVGHIEVEHNSGALCRCGNYGCLEALAGGAALTRGGIELARSATSRFLAERLADAGTIEFTDIAAAADHGDPDAAKLLNSSARHVGQMLATLVNFHNPSLIVIGGSVARSGDSYLATVRQMVLNRSLPLATRELRITPSPLKDRAGLLGAAFLVIDELFSPAVLDLWIDTGHPSGLTGGELSEAS